MHQRISVLLEAIDLEEKEERKRYQLDGTGNLKNLKNSGLAIHPIRITRKSYGYLDYPEFSFTAPFPVDGSAFRDGCAIELFLSSEETIKGMLLYFDGRKGECRILGPDFPEWIEEDGVGIKLAPDIRTIQRMKESIIGIETNNRLQQLFTTIHSNKPEKTALNPNNTCSLNWHNKNLNPSQHAAIANIVDGTYEIQLVHGPPGTGKTTTLLEAVAHLCEKNKRILVSAPSNAAVDHFACQLQNKHPRIEFLRIGNNTKVSETLLPFTPEGKLKNSKEEKEVKRLKIQAEELRRMAHQYKRRFGKDERDQRNLILKEVKLIRKQIRDIQTYNEEKLFEKAQVILGTPMAISDELKNHPHTYDILILDEAGQCLEPLAWSIFPFVEQIVLAGDHHQLPPTILSAEAIQLGFNKSILEVCMDSIPNYFLLNTQYRMKHSIAEFSNRYFYNGLVVTPPNLITETDAVYFFDTSGSEAEEETGQDGNSLLNKGEAEAISKLIREFQLSPKETVILSPYSGQVSYLKEILPEFKSSTIDSYQGQEEETVIISLVRSNSSGIIGFLKDYRRMNVAMTRARSKLFLLGNSGTLGSDHFYTSFMEYIESIQAYHSVWEFTD